MESKSKSKSTLISDLTVLKSIWFSKAKGNDHAERLEHFYKAQAEEYDSFRDKFLWARRPMLAASAARLQSKRTDSGRSQASAATEKPIWVDLGGGTGENVAMMEDYMDLSAFSAVYVVDLCHSLCNVTKAKIASRQAKGQWKNVHCVEGDACEFSLPAGAKAGLVTFSYSLTMIPPFHSAVDNAISMLSDDGYLSVADFYCSSKYDLPMRQMSWGRRFFWRSIFDTDNIDIGPERRNYLDHHLERVSEYNSQGSIPYVPYLRAPNYVWVGQKKRDHSGDPYYENRAEAPPLFPPTFLYSQSWEDPEPDMKVFDLGPKDVVLTLTSGGCNSLNLLVHGAAHVVSVDCNPAQSSLLELKAVAIKQLPYADVWQLFGEGRHPDMKALYDRKLAPFLSETALNFWNSRLHYFKQGLYYQGGMGKLCYILHTIGACVGLTKTRLALADAPTLEAQRRVWDSMWLVRFIRSGSGLIVNAFVQLLTLIFLNRLVLWFGGGVPPKQYKLIVDDGVKIQDYIGRTFDGVARHSHLRKDNYFYYNCLTGHFTRDNCPSYLREDNFNLLKAGAIDKLTNTTRTFMDELTARRYNKVVLMDHLDWMDDAMTQQYAAVLAQQVVPGGVVIWRSAAFEPPYTRFIREAGFDVVCKQRADKGYMDRVNMYSSFYVATRKGKKSL